VAYVKGVNGLVKVLCILDTAAGHSTIDEEFASSVGLAMKHRRKKTIQYLERSAEVETAKCKFELVSQDKSRTFKIRADAVKGFSHNCYLWPWHEFVTKHPHLVGVNPPHLSHAPHRVHSDRCQSSGSPPRGGVREE